MIAGPGAVIGYAAAAVAALMVTLWAVSVRIKDVSIVDPAWGPAFVLVALTSAVSGDGDGARRWLIAAMTAVWGARLGVHLANRKRHEPEEDRRYAAMRDQRGDAFTRWSLYGIFGTQGLLVLVVSLPITVSAQSGSELGASAIPGIAVYVLGLAFEAIGDAQLSRFKADGANTGKVMDRGLWRYTRHPNYFGDFCVWWGLWLVALPADGLWWTAIGPIVMSTLLIRVSGKGLLEKTIGARRPGYAEYVATTSGFLPRPPKLPRGASR